MALGNLIEKRVVFLLGAGASCGYGYPSGEKLKAALTAVNGDQLAVLKKAGIDGQSVHDFKHRLAHCGLPSVDAFLARNPTFSKIAKIRIAQELAVAEQTAATSLNRSESWYEYLFGRMMDDGALDHFERNRCVFVTLNYDRSLEYELAKMLSNAYEAPWDECVRAVAKLEIIHLHGSLGMLNGFAADGVAYGMINDADAVLKAAKTILTLGESGSEKEYNRAAALIEEAEVILCLGFGYHPEVIQRLKLATPSKIPVHGTCQGWTLSEVNKLKQLFAPRDFSEVYRDATLSTGMSRSQGPAVDYLRANVQLFML